LRKERKSRLSLAGLLPKGGGKEEGEASMNSSLDKKKINLPMGGGGWRMGKSANSSRPTDATRKGGGRKKKGVTALHSSLRGNCRDLALPMLRAVTKGFCLLPYPG